MPAINGTKSRRKPGGTKTVDMELSYGVAEFLRVEKTYQKSHSTYIARICDSMQNSEELNSEDEVSAPARLITGTVTKRLIKARVNDELSSLSLRARESVYKLSPKSFDRLSKLLLIVASESDDELVARHLTEVRGILAKVEK